MIYFERVDFFFIQHNYTEISKVSLQLKLKVLLKV